MNGRRIVVRAGVTAWPVTGSAELQIGVFGNSHWYALSLTEGANNNAIINHDGGPTSKMSFDSSTDTYEIRHTPGAVSVYDSGSGLLLLQNASNVSWDNGEMRFKIHANCTNCTGPFDWWVDEVDVY